MKKYTSIYTGKEIDERLSKVDNIPTKTSELNNDSGFISETEADNKYTDKNKTDVLEKDIKNLEDRIDVEIPTKISQLKNDKNYITNSEVQNKLNNLNNTVDYFGDIIELNITSKGGNIDSVEVNEDALVDTLLTKASLDENGKIIISQFPDYILGQVMFGGLIYSDGTIIASSNFRSKYGNDTNISTNEASKYNGVYFIVTGEVVNMTIAGVSNVSTGDWIISVGDSWKKIDNSDAVTSVAGLVGNVNASSLAAALSDITDSNSLAKKTDLPTKLSDLEADIEIGGNTEYESMIEDKTLTTPNAVGGIAKGTKVSDLEGKTFSEMFDDLLFPTVNPEFTAPSASIAFKNYSSTQEVGATGPTSANFTAGYNAGEIKLNGVKQANRGGTLNNTNSFIYVNGSSSNKTLPTKVTLGSTTFKYRAAYNQGPQPKNNKGGNYASPLAAGTVDSSAITLNGTYPWYASTSSATSANPVVKQSLVAWNATAGKMSTGQFTVQPSGTLPQVFKLPRKIDVLQLKNALNGNMENVEEINGIPKDYTESTETINIGGTNVTYYVYTYSGSTRGSVTLLAKF